MNSVVENSTASFKFTGAQQNSEAARRPQEAFLLRIGRSKLLRAFLAWQLLAAPALHGVAQAQGLRQIEALGQIYSAAQPVTTSLARITLFRPVDDSGARAVSVYIDSAYHTTLIKGGFAQVCVLPGTVEIGLRRVEDTALARNNIEVARLDLIGGEQQILRVSDQPSIQTGLRVVTPAQAFADLAQTRLQQHTISRAKTVKPCVEVAPVVAPAPVIVAPIAAPPPPPPQIISLASDALFPFGKSGLNDMLATGRVALDDVINRVKSEYASVDTIKVVAPLTLAVELLNRQL